MEFRVNRRLLLIAGCVWIIAGINILRIGIITWLNYAHYWLFKVGEAIVVFLLFFQFVFRRLFVKHSERISQKGEKNCPFSFFDVKGWIVMIFMITRCYDPSFPIASQLFLFRYFIPDFHLL